MYWFWRVVKFSQSYIGLILPANFLLLYHKYNNIAIPLNEFLR